MKRELVKQAQEALRIDRASFKFGRPISLRGVDRELKRVKGGIPRP